jgi:hypothetical protein
MVRSRQLRVVAFNDKIEPSAAMQSQFDHEINGTSAAGVHR